jgi:hypothetical protein
MTPARFLSDVVPDDVRSNEDYEVCDPAGLRMGIVVVEDVAYTISVQADMESITSACEEEGWLLP